jgi:RNA polymerase sigma-70 factor (ECF subfamily)
LPSESQEKKNHREETADTDARFKKLYLEHRTRIYWYIYRKISRQEEAQDLTADVFLKLYENMEDLEGRKKGAMLAWLYTVARNQSIDYLRKKSARKTAPLDENDHNGATKVFDNFVSEAMKESDIAEMKRFLDSVDETAREVMQLRYEEDLKFSEISEVVGKSEGACKMILYRALEKLREDIDKSRKNKKG